MWMNWNKKLSLETRIKEHEAKIKKHKKTTAQHKHTADLSSVNILDQERKSSTRYKIESLRIEQKIDNMIKSKEDTDNINYIYSFAL